MARVQHTCTGCVPIDAAIIEVYLQLLGLKDSTIEAAERAEHAAEYAIGKSPYIGDNGNWWEWDDDESRFIDTGVQAQGSIAVDAQLDPNSTNPVQNKVTTQALAGKQDAIDDLTEIRSGAAAGATAYQKPDTGIPAADMASGVQSSLGKADMAYQKPSGGVPKTDLASGVQNSLSRADESYVRPYDSQSPNGMGYLVLEKDKTFASQVTDTNTIYEIRYDFTLEDDFQIPSGCVLDFRGGSIDGEHILDLNDCEILGTNEWIGTSLMIAGKTATPCYADWFKGSDADKVEKALDMFSVVHLNARDYLIGRQIVISHSFALYGDGFQDFFGKTSNTSEISDYSRSRLIATEQMDSILFLKKDSTISSFGSYVLNGISFTTDASVQRTVNGVKISTPGGPSRPINIHCCNFRFLKYGVYITGSTSASNNSTNTLCVTITSSTLAQNDWGLYVDGHHAVGLLCVDGCNVEQNITGGIYAYDATYVPVFCGIEIKNTLLEGQDTAIYIKSDGYVKLNSNYYERTTVTQTIHIEGPSYQSPLIVDIVGEHGSNSTNILYDLKYLVVKSFYIDGPSSLSNGSVIVSADTCYFLELPQITELRITKVVCFPVDSFDDEPDTPFGEVRIQGKQNAIVCGKPAMWSLPASNTLFDNNIPSFTPGKYRAVFYVYVNRLADHYAQFRDITAQQNFSDCSLYAKLFIGRLIKCVTDLDITTTGTGDIRLTYKNRGTDGALLGSSAGLFQSTKVPKYRPQILSKGTSTQRPLATTFGAGFTYFDETLGKMIVSNGTAWVNMDGTAL